MSLNIWQTFPFDFHIIDLDACEQRFGVFSLVRAEACLSRIQHFAVVGCLHACFQSLAHTPSLSVYLSNVPRLKLTALLYPYWDLQTQLKPQVNNLP